MKNKHYGSPLKSMFNNGHCPEWKIPQLNYLLTAHSTRNKCLYSLVKLLHKLIWLMEAFVTRVETAAYPYHYSNEWCMMSLQFPLHCSTFAHLRTQAYSSCYLSIFVYTAFTTPMQYCSVHL